MIYKAWLADFPNDRGSKSGLVSICMRIHKPDFDRLTPHITDPIHLDKNDFPSLENPQQRDIHLRLGLLDMGDLILLHKAIGDYLGGL